MLETDALYLYVNGKRVVSIARRWEDIAHLFGYEIDSSAPVLQEGAR